MTFTILCRLLSQAVIHSRQPVALNWARNSFGLVLTVFLRKICILGIAEYFLIVLFQISEIKKDEIRFKKYIFLLDMFLIVGGEGSSNRNASRDESVEAGDKSVEAGEKTPQSCYNTHPHFYWLSMIKYRFQHCQPTPSLDKKIYNYLWLFLLVLECIVINTHT